MKTVTSRFLTILFVAAMAFSLLTTGAAQAFGQDHSDMDHSDMDHPKTAQFVALDECDPTTFNTVLGPDFCKNVALAAFGYATTLADLLAGVQANNPSKSWDFEPDSMTVPRGTVVSVVDQGGEPHTFTEVKNFGGGFLAPLNAPGQTTAPECVGGFSTVAVAKTRIIQGSTIQVTNLTPGEHRFQCCIHPWMRVTVDVK